MLKPGDRVPEAAGIGADGKPLQLRDLWGKGPVVMFFYPKDFTMVCTREACLFRDTYAELAEGGADVVGVSRDDGESHARFRSEHRLPYRLLSDPEQQLARAFGIARPLGLPPMRVTFVVDAGGVVRGAFHHELMADRHVADVRKALAALGPA